MNVVVGILAAWGFIMLLWTLFGLLLLPLRRRDDTRMTVVLQGACYGRHMEHYLRGLQWVRNSGSLWWDILVVKDGLSMPTLENLSSLAARESHVYLLSLEELKDWMEENHAFAHERTDPDSGDCGSGPL